MDVLTTQHTVEEKEMKKIPYAYAEEAHTY
jgi:hypothetical protein